MIRPLLLFSVGALCLSLLPDMASAGLIIPGGNNSEQALTNFFNVTNAFTPLPHTPAGDPDGIAEQFVPQVVRLLLSVFNIGVVIAFFYAGVLWVTSQGNEDQVQRAARTALYALLAALVAAMAYAIVFAVGNLNF